MNTKLLTIVLLIMGAVLSGCVESDEVTTHNGQDKEPSYTAYLRDNGNAMYLLSDGTYIIYQPGHSTFPGKYTKIGDVLYLEYTLLGTDECLRFVWDDDCYVDNDGDRWFLEQ